MGIWGVWCITGDGFSLVSLWEKESEAKYEQVKMEERFPQQLYFTRPHTVESISLFDDEYHEWMNTYYETKNTQYTNRN